MISEILIQFNAPITPTLNSFMITLVSNDSSKFDSLSALNLGFIAALFIKPSILLNVLLFYMN